MIILISIIAFLYIALFYAIIWVGALGHRDHLKRGWYMKDGKLTKIQP